ncbi:MAG: TPM domain-containing protein [Planctomycetota bacterium]|nr:TPM domain-containing protein [Planctomycetota bacterium]
MVMQEIDAQLPGDGAQEVWSEGFSWWTQLGEWSPWILGTLALILIVRAMLRRGRYRALGVLGDPEQARVHAAIKAAELKTVGEIVPVVVERSDPHPGAAWIAAMCFLVLGSALLVPVLPWGQPVWLLATQFGLGAVGFFLARMLPDIARLFISRERAAAVCEEQAFQEFHKLGLQKTEAATGVLVFISLLEHHVVVLADEGIDAVVEQETWERVTKAALDGVSSDDVVGGVVDAVTACGEVLSRHFPWVDGDRNELPDRLEVRRE